MKDVTSQDPIYEQSNPIHSRREFLSLLIKSFCIAIVGRFLSACNSAEEAVPSTPLPTQTEIPLPNKWEIDQSGGISREKINTLIQLIESFGDALSMKAISNVTKLFDRNEETGREIFGLYYQSSNFAVTPSSMTGAWAKFSLSGYLDPDQQIGQAQPSMNSPKEEIMILFKPVFISMPSIKLHPDLQQYSDLFSALFLAKEASHVDILPATIELTVKLFRQSYPLIPLEIIDIEIFQNILQQELVSLTLNIMGFYEIFPLIARLLEQDPYFKNQFLSMVPTYNNKSLVEDIKSKVQEGILLKDAEGNYKWSESATVQSKEVLNFLGLTFFGISWGDALFNLNNKGFQNARKIARNIKEKIETEGFFARLFPTSFKEPRRI